MFISAKMISITNLKPSDYLKELDNFAFDISVIAISAAIFVLLLFTVTKKYKRLPHRITCCLVVSQLISSVGVILWSKLGQETAWKMYLQFSFFTIGQFSSRLWTAFLAITLLFLNSRSLCFALKLWRAFLLVGFGVPILLTGILFLVDIKNILPKEKQNPSFQFGNVQAVISVFLLVMCFLVTVGCLILHQRYKRRFEKYLTLSKEVASPDSDTITTAASSTTNINGSLARIDSGVNFTINNVRRRRSISSDDDDIAGCSGSADNGQCCSAPVKKETRVVDIEDIIPKGPNVDANNLCSSQFGCASTSREACQSLVQRYQEQSHNDLEPIEFEEDVDTYQVLKHTALLILLLCSMFVSFALTIWTLIMDGMSGIYVELCFLDAFLNFGQSFIVFACFIGDSGELFEPVIVIARKLWYGANAISIPNWNELSDETKHVCEQFTSYHLERCRKAIAKDKRWRIKVYKKVFYGVDFTDYLIEVGLARDRAEAVKYGKRLVDGRVMRHINNCQHFADKKLLFTFCSRL
jgi:Domain found in Dishevelled, Egl-10, and Pleckstrin (DEP)